MAAAAGLYGYRWYNRPVTLTLAVGSIDGEAARAMSAIASQLASDGASVRLKQLLAPRRPQRPDSSAQS
jgi:hypothetical protein